MLKNIDFFSIHQLFGKTCLWIYVLADADILEEALMIMKQKTEALL